MPISFVEDKIKKAFSSAAMQYDTLNGLHREIGRELVETIECDPFPKTLVDIGTGTGYVANKLQNIFKESKVYGLDFASGMIDVALEKYPELNLIQGNAHQFPFKPQTLDCIVSNLSFQWMNDLEKVFQGCFDSLTDSGQMTLTLFGHDTFAELFESIDVVNQCVKKPLATHRLKKIDDVVRAFQKAGFSTIEHRTERIQVRFPDLLGMMKWIKDIGANGLYREGFMGKQYFSQLEMEYKKKYCDVIGIRTTFEVIWLKGQKRV